MSLSRFTSWVYINVVRLFNRTELYQPTYNPHNYPIFKPNIFKRQSTNRIAIINRHVDFNKVNSYLDIGSQFGYFVFKLSANHNLVAHGLERDVTAFRYSQAKINLNQVKNVGFINTELTPKTANLLPKYDLISCLNLFHHLVYYQGFKAADSIMKILAQKCTFFVFETGQSNETSQVWSYKLKFMGKNPKEWINQYLLKLGYKIIYKQDLATHLGKTKRGFFVCKKVNSQ